MNDYGWVKVSTAWAPTLPFVAFVEIPRVNEGVKVTYSGSGTTRAAAMRALDRVLAKVLAGIEQTHVIERLP